MKEQNLSVRVYQAFSSICLLTISVGCTSSETAREQADEQLPVPLVPFKLDYVVEDGIFLRSGPELAKSEPGLDLGGSSRWLRIRTSVGANASTVEGGHAMWMYAGESVEEFGSGDPIGLFYDSLDNDELDKIWRTVQSPWWRQPPLSGRGHNAGLYRVRCTSSAFSIDRELNPYDGPFISSVYELATEFDRLTASMPKYATLAIQVRAERNGADPKEHLLWVSLVNEGTKPIVLTDPRIPRQRSPKAGPRFEPDVPRFEWKIGTMVRMDPFTPSRDWTSLPIPSLPSDAPRSLVVDAGERFELSGPWIAPEPGNYMLRAHWDDYDGPIAPVDGQLPVMPLSDDGQLELGPGPYPIRGHAYVELVFEVVASPD